MLVFSNLSKILTRFSTLRFRRKPSQEESSTIKHLQTQKKTAYFSFKLSHRINALFKKRKISAALALFCSMVQVNNKEKSELVQKNRTSSSKKNFLFVRPSVPVYNTLLKGLRDHGCSALAYKFFVDMKKRALVPDLISYNLLLDSIIRRAMLDASPRDSCGPDSRLTEQVQDPLNFCWDQFQEMKLKISSQQKTDFRLVFNTLIKAIGILGHKYGSDLDTLRVVFSPFVEENKFPLSPGFGIAPCSDTICIAIKAAINLNAPLWFIEAYYDGAVCSKIQIDPFIVCSLLSAYRLHMSGLALDSPERIKIAEKCIAIVDEHAKSAPFLKSELFHGLAMTIYMSTACTCKKEHFLSVLITHYEKYGRMVKDPICLSLYMRAVLLLKHSKELSFVDLMEEVVKYKRQFPKWPYDRQIEILSVFVPSFEACKDAGVREAIRDCLFKLENSKILWSIRKTLEHQKAPLSADNLAKTKSLIETLRKYQ